MSETKPPKTGRGHEAGPAALHPAVARLLDVVTVESAAGGNSGASWADALRRRAAKKLRDVRKGYEPGRSAVVYYDFRDRKRLCCLLEDDLSTHASTALRDPVGITGVEVLRTGEGILFICPPDEEGAVAGGAAGAVAESGGDLQGATTGSADSSSHVAIGAPPCSPLQRDLYGESVGWSPFRYASCVRFTPGSVVRKRTTGDNQPPSTLAAPAAASDGSSKADDDDDDDDEVPYDEDIALGRGAAATSGDASRVGQPDRDLILAVALDMMPAAHFVFVFVPMPKPPPRYKVPLVRDVAALLAACDGYPGWFLFVPQHALAVDWTTTRGTWLEALPNDMESVSNGIDSQRFVVPWLEGPSKRSSKGNHDPRDTNNNSSVLFPYRATLALDSLPRFGVIGHNFILQVTETQEALGNCGTPGSVYYLSTAAKLQADAMYAEFLSREAAVAAQEASDKAQAVQKAKPPSQPLRAAEPSQELSSVVQETAGSLRGGHDHVSVMTLSGRDLAAAGVPRAVWHELTQRCPTIVPQPQAAAIKDAAAADNASSLAEPAANSSSAAASPQSVSEAATFVVALHSKEAWIAFEVIKPSIASPDGFDAVYLCTSAMRGLPLAVCESLAGMGKDTGTCFLKTVAVLRPGIDSPESTTLLSPMPAGQVRKIGRSANEKRGRGDVRRPLATDVVAPQTARESSTSSDSDSSSSASSLSASSSSAASSRARRKKKASKKQKNKTKKSIAIKRAGGDLTDKVAALRVAKPAAPPASAPGKNKVNRRKPGTETAAPGAGPSQLGQDSMNPVSIYNDLLSCIESAFSADATVA